MIFKWFQQFLPTRTIRIAETIEIERNPPLSVEEKKALVSVLGKPEMKVFWRYLGYKIDKCTRDAMQSEDKDETHDFKVSSRAFGRIIVDRENYKRDIEQSKKDSTIEMEKNVREPNKIFKAPRPDGEQVE
jgi:hypothetical protein|tara:strand:- start:2879 stop:3271 length:393 start_codon:yes stop_codon:yes gene_type:complete